MRHTRYHSSIIPLFYSNQCLHKQQQRWQQQQQCAFDRRVYIYYECNVDIAFPFSIINQISSLFFFFLLSIQHLFQVLFWRRCPSKIVTPSLKVTATPPLAITVTPPPSLNTSLSLSAVQYSAVHPLQWPSYASVCSHFCCSMSVSLQ